MAAIKAAKKQWRKQLQPRWQRLEQAFLLQGAAAALCPLQKLSSWTAADAVLLFFARQDELPTIPLIRLALAAGKTVALPRVLPDYQLEARQITGFGSLSRGTYGLWEPSPRRCPLLAPQALQFIVVPGLAFDRHGNRLGRGAGFYDRFLARVDRRRTAVAAWTLSQFVFPAVPASPEDQPVDWLVTEKGTEKTDLDQNRPAASPGLRRGEIQ